jgi:hypothetical protein
MTLPVQNLFGIQVQTKKPCSCGSLYALIAEGKNIHAASLRCEKCDAFREWVAHDVIMFSIACVELFGRPEAPVVLRKPPSPPEQSANGEDGSATSAQTTRSTKMPIDDNDADKMYAGGDYYGGKDFPGRKAIERTVDDANKVKFKRDNGESEERIVLKFKEPNSKLLSFNKTNYRNLFDELGKPSTWPGQKVMMSGTDTPKGRGVSVHSAEPPNVPE